MEITHLIDTSSHEVLCKWLVENHTMALEVWVTTSHSLPPRRGHWTELNLSRCRALIAQGRMTEAGQAE